MNWFDGWNSSLIKIGNRLLRKSKCRTEEQWRYQKWLAKELDIKARFGLFTKEELDWFRENESKRPN